MASIRAQGERFEIRECLGTEHGPRQRALARFDRILTPEVLDAAAAQARRPFDRRALLARARAQGIPIAEARHPGAARELLRALREGERLSPALVGLLRAALAELPSAPLPPHLEDAAEWLGADEASRGRALRGLLRAGSRVARSRELRRERPRRPFPRFRSTPRGE